MLTHTTPAVTDWRELARLEQSRARGRRILYRQRATSERHAAKLQVQVEETSSVTFTGGAA